MLSPQPETTGAIVPPMTRVEAANPEHCRAEGEARGYLWECRTCDHEWICATDETCPRCGSKRTGPVDSF